jgi:hypothetical protein
MTTIACDGRTIAADGLRVIGNEVVTRSERKIFHRHGRIYAVTGVAMCLDAAIEWHNAGAKRGEMPVIGEGKEDDAYSLLVVEPHGVRRYSSPAEGFGEVYPFPCSFGSGSAYAEAIMANGGSPMDGVKIASQLCIYTGGDIFVMQIAGPQLGGVVIVPEMRRYGAAIEQK